MIDEIVGYWRRARGRDWAIGVGFVAAIMGISIAMNHLGVGEETHGLLLAVLTIGLPGCLHLWSHNKIRASVSDEQIDRYAAINGAALAMMMSVLLLLAMGFVAGALALGAHLVGWI